MMAVTTLQTYAFILITLAASQAECYGIEMDLLRVECDVEHRYAVTHVTAAVTNRKNTSQEIPLKMTLPRNAYVTSLVMDVGGRNFSTVVTEKRRNRKRGPTPNRTEPHKNRKRDENTQKFRASAKARGLQKVIFYLSYEELLHRTKGRYTHTLYLGAAKSLGVVEVRVRVVEKEALKDFRILHLPWSSSTIANADGLPVHQEVHSPGNITISFNRVNVTAKLQSNITITDDDEDEDADVNDDDDADDDEDDGIFSVTYDIDRQADGGELQVLGQFFVHYFSPEGLPKLPTHTVFVLDVSGSMHDNGKLQQLKMAMRAILTDLQVEDSFEILVFSTRVTSLGVFKAEANEIERSLSKIQRLQALGGTNFNDALLKALQEINSFNLTSGAKQIVFLTDGQPNLGEKKPNQLRRNIREANIHHHPIFSLGFGQDADMRLLRQVSSDNRGFTRKIDEDVRPAEQLKGFYDEISAPLMTDVDVLYLEDQVDLNSVVRHGPSTFYAGDEMVLAGQLMEGVTQVQPIITGQGSTGPIQFRVSRISTTEPPPERDNYVERLWAYLTVQDLLDTQEVAEDNNLRAEMNARALEIALRFHFVTQLTSLDLEEPNETPDGEGHPYKSPSRHQKSNTGGLKLLPDELTLLSEAEFAKTLPAPLSTRLNMASHNRFSFGDNDPHFVVQVSGIEMPLCFDIHGQHNQVLSLVRDSSSGIMVTGRVTSAVGRPEATYFTELFVGLGKVNFTITPHNITISTVEGHGDSEGSRVLRSVWPFRKMYRSGGRGDKPRHHSNRKVQRQKRSHNSELRLKQQARRNLTNLGTENQVNSLQGQHSPHTENRSQRRVSSQSLRRDQSRHELYSRNHITRAFNSIYQNTFKNPARRGPWDQNYKSTLTRNNFRGHESNSVLKNIPKDRNKIPSSITNTNAKAIPYNHKSQTRYFNHLHLSTPSLDGYDIHSSQNINKRHPLNSTREKHERKRRQRRWSKFRKRGKMRYKRNNLLTTNGDQFQNLNTYRNQNINMNTTPGSTTNRHVHPHAAINHKLRGGSSRPHWIRHQAHMLRNKHHSKSFSKPLYASVNHALVTHESADELDGHPRHRYLQRQTVKHHHPFGNPVMNEGNPDTPKVHLVSPSNTFTHYQSLGQYQQHTSPHSKNVLLQDHTSTRGTEHLTHTHSITNSTSTVRQDNKNSPTLRAEPPSRSKIHPQAHIPLLFQGNQSHHHINKVNARFPTPASCNQTAEQQANSQATFQNIGCLPSPRTGRVHLPPQEIQRNSESSVKLREFPETQIAVTRLEVSEGQALISQNLKKYSFDSSDFNTELQESQELNRDEDEDVNDEDLSEEEQSMTSHDDSPHIYHPQSRVFSQAQIENTSVVSDPETAPSIRPGTDASQKVLNIRNRQDIPTEQEAPNENFKTEGCHRKKSTRTYTWRRAAGRRYGEIIVTLRNRKKVDLLIGDVDAHFVITRSKTKYGQEFLGFYVEEHKILSPNTTGIIGQFAYKTVGTMTSTTSAGDGENNEGMKLAVLQPQPNMQYRVSEVNGFVSKRRSMLHKSHVRCLLIPNQGQGLVAGNPEDYLLPCLCC